MGKILKGRRNIPAVPAEPDIDSQDKAHRETVYQITALLVIVGLGIFIYSNTLESPFYFDDRANITENTRIRLTELSLKGIYEAGFKSILSQRPIANISFALNYYFGEYNIVGYHYVNIGIHILAGIFLYFFVKNTLRIPLLQQRYPDYRWISFFAALLWLVHPIQIQSVSYIVQRMNSLAAMFYILSMLLYVKGRLKGRDGRRSWPWLTGSVVAGVLAFGSKEISATLPFFIFLYEWYFFQNLSGSWLKRCVPYIAGIVVIFVLLGLFYLDFKPVEQIMSRYERRDFTMPERLLTQSRVVIYYISLLAYTAPGRLNLDHYFTISQSLFNPLTTLPAIAAVFGLIGLAVYLAKKERLISFCILWFFGNLAIESSFLGLELIFEHRVYLPSMLVYMVVTVLVWRFVKRDWVNVAVFSIVVVVLSAGSYKRNSMWSDPVTLWRDCANKLSKKPRPNYNLAYFLNQEGQTAEAIKYYKQTLELDPNHFAAHSNLGLALIDIGEINQAVVHFNKALRLDPDSADAHCNIGLAFHRQNKLDKAIEYYNRALLLKPRSSKVHDNLAMSYYQQGKVGKAISHWTEAIELEPDSLNALNNLSWVLSTHQESRYRNAGEGLRLAKRACELTGYENPGMLDTLAAAYAATGDFSKAIETAERAVEIAVAAGDKRMAEDIHGRLELYRAGQPYREMPVTNEISP